MGLRSIKGRDYSLVVRELGYLEAEGKITKEQYDDIISDYNRVSNNNFLRVVVTIGALLLGIGILLFIASNWSYLSGAIKFLLIITLVGAFNGSGYVLRYKYPRISKSLIYVGYLAYGAGLFLISQLFNYTLNMSTLFFVWYAGIIPMAVCMNDSILIGLSQAILLIYMFNNYQYRGVPLIMFAIIPISFYTNRKRLDNSVMEIFNIIQGITLILMVCNTLEVRLLVVTLLMLCIGVVLSCIKLNAKFGKAYNVIGNILTGVTGVMLTFYRVWEYEIRRVAEDGRIVYSYLDFRAIMWVFIGVYVLYLFYKIKQGSLFNIIVLVTIIFRFYIDITYDFLPKSLFFIVGGAILIGFGVYFEKKRKKVGEGWGLNVG